MPTLFKRRKNTQYLSFLIIFVGVFTLISLAYIKRETELDRRQFHTHANIIANDIWALNRSGAKAYLELAVRANHYQSLAVSIPGETEFLQVRSVPLSGITAALAGFGLIGVKDLSEDILHQDQTIGTLLGRQYVRVIFPLLNILGFLLLVVLTSTFIFHLFRNRRFLEQQVMERTRNLRESERRFHDLVDLLPEMVLETDLQGRVEYCNQVAKERLKLSFTLGIPPNFSEFLARESRSKATEHFRVSLLNGSSGLQEFTAIDPENRAFPILMRLAPIRRDDRIQGARMIVVDITERHHLEEQLLRDQKMKAIGLMAGGVAHDLNNILSGVISYPELLLLDLEKNHKMRRPLEAIRKSGLDAAEVVADLLTVARGIAASREVVNPNTLIRDYLSSVDFHQLKLRFPHIAISQTLEGDLRNISCSPIHIRKCLMNLITNGMEAIQGMGTLSISSSNHQQVVQCKHNKQVLPQGVYVKIAICDSGTGIAPHEIEHIFEPFYTKKVMGRSGTGLGLAVVWNTMLDHGGVVDVLSNSHGTTFELYLPAVDEQEPALSTPADWTVFQGQGEKVLVVDDEPRQREIAMDLLSSLNYQVVTKASGEEAVAYLATHDADILVLDMIMDPGQNGRTTYEEILKIHPRQKAIIASGYAEDDDVRATLALGAGQFVGKPYTLEKIGAAIYKTLKA